MPPNNTSRAAREMLDGAQRLREARKREEDDEQTALLAALNQMGAKNWGRHIRFDGNDRDAVESALHEMGFTVVREKYVKRP